MVIQHVNSLRTGALALAAVLWPCAALADAPHDITTGLRLWLDGLDVSGTDVGNGGSTNPANAAQVTLWQDKSANAKTAGDATGFGALAHTLPTYIAGKGVSFNGVSNALQVSGTGVYNNGEVVSESDIFILYAINNSNYNFIFYNGSGATNTSRMSSHFPWADGTIYWDHGSLGSTGRVTWNWTAAGGAYGRYYQANLYAKLNVNQGIINDGGFMVNANNTATYTHVAGNKSFIGKVLTERPLTHGRA